MPFGGFVSLSGSCLPTSGPHARRTGFELCAHCVVRVTRSPHFRNFYPFFRSANTTHSFGFSNQYKHTYLGSTASKDTVKLRIDTGNDTRNENFRRKFFTDNPASIQILKKVVEFSRLFTAQKLPFFTVVLLERFRFLCREGKKFEHIFANFYF